MFFVVGIAQLECGPHPPLLNGKILFQNATVAYIMCDYGFLLIGSEYRICDITRNWPGSQPVCEGMVAYSAVEGTLPEALLGWHPIECGPQSWLHGCNVIVQYQKLT